MKLAEVVERGWQLFGTGDFDELIKDYTESMKLVMPGQADILEGRQSFRSALDSISNVIPTGFEITGLRHIEGTNEVISIVEWKSAKVQSSQLCILFKFDGDKISEERWFVDTEQWKNAS